MRQKTNQIPAMNKSRLRLHRIAGRLERHALKYYESKPPSLAAIGDPEADKKFHTLQEQLWSTEVEQILRELLDKRMTVCTPELDVYVGRRLLYGAKLASYICATSTDAAVEKLMEGRTDDEVALNLMIGGWRLLESDDSESD